MDTDSMIAYGLIIIVLLVFSAFFSACETSMTSLSRPRLKNAARGGNKRARRTLRFVEDYDRTLSTILVGNNLVNILASSLCTVLFTALFGSGGIGWATVAMTVVILIVGEITPKSYAKQKPERTALFVTPLLTFFYWLLSPVNWLFSLWRRLMNRAIKPEETPALTEDELVVLIEESEREGALAQNESELIQSAIAFEDITVREVLTPRVDVVMAEDTDGAADMLTLFQRHHHSRVPIYHETTDDVIGIVHEKDFYPAYLADPDFRPADIARKALFVPDSLKISALLSRLRRDNAHIAVVIDQYGGTLGIVTMEDVLEELVGEIYDESDKIETPIVRLGEDSWRVNGATAISDVFEAIGVEYDDDEIDSTSIGGLVTELAGRLPGEGDEFRYRDLGITVTSVRERRVAEVEIVRLAELTPDDD